MKSKLIFNKATQMFGPHSGLWNSAGACPGCWGMSFLPGPVCVGVLGKITGSFPKSTDLTICDKVLGMPSEIFIGLFYLCLLIVVLFL